MTPTLSNHYLRQLLKAKQPTAAGWFYLVYFGALAVLAALVLL